MKRISLGSCPAPAQQGITLIEMMISMVLGLIIISGVMGAFISTTKTLRQTDDLSRIQENARVAVQLIGRSLREAGVTPCGLPPGKGLIVHTPATLANISNWWAGGTDFKDSIRGYPASAMSNFPAKDSSTPPVSGSDGIIVVSGGEAATTVSNDTGTAMTVQSASGFTSNSYLFACSVTQGYGVVFQPTGLSGTTIQHPAFTVTGIGTLAPTHVGRLTAEGWFVAPNSEGGTSLYRGFLQNNGTATVEEIAPDISKMEITYLLSGENSYTATVADTAWPNLLAVYINLTITRQPAGSSTDPITRTVGLTVNLRNRFELSSTGTP
ncbi:MAG: prepilin-type N-terminal cleavage/methylation domain-containing protein [Azoarcus sp.]|jgi:type IV pilus assembly protein PilW|nr:prepilin-type N-terminal cleavage/methylation domain-containing protein [Azoarcus sp.]